jgi:hypothetical protein
MATRRRQRRQRQRRKSQRRQRSQRSQRSQRGGRSRSCSARPSNRQLFGFGQRGGVADFGSIGGPLLSGNDQIAAGVSGFYSENAAAQQMAALSHSGGRRRQRSRRQRRQRGGEADFGASYSLGVSNPDVAARFASGVNGGSV